MAVSSSSSHTIGEPSAAPQKCPTAGEPSPDTAPRKPQSARKAFPGSSTHNSLPSGSASTTCSSSGCWPTSRCLAPSSSARATVASCAWSEVLVRSKCRGFGPTLGRSLGTNRSRKPVSSTGSTATPPRGSSAVGQPRTPAQNAASRTGSRASKQNASIWLVIEPASDRRETETLAAGREQRAVVLLVRLVVLGEVDGGDVATGLGGHQPVQVEVPAGADVGGRRGVGDPPGEAQRR